MNSFQFSPQANNSLQRAEQTDAPSKLGKKLAYEKNLG
jgi:hypothetical protein